MTDTPDATPPVWHITTVTPEYSAGLQSWSVAGTFNVDVVSAANFPRDPIPMSCQLGETVYDVDVYVFMIDATTGEWQGRITGRPRWLFEGDEQ